MGLEWAICLELKDPIRLPDTLDNLWYLDHFGRSSSIGTHRMAH